MLVIIRGGGDLASGVAVRLYRSGFRVLITELPQPLVVRRTVSFAEAVHEGLVLVEDIIGELLRGLFQILKPPTSHCGHQYPEEARPKAILVSPGLAVVQVSLHLPGEGLVGHGGQINFNEEGEHPALMLILAETIRAELAGNFPLRMIPVPVFLLTQTLRYPSAMSHLRMLYHRFLECYPELGCGQGVIKCQQEAAGASLPLQIAHPLEHFRPLYAHTH